MSALSVFNQFKIAEEKLKVKDACISSLLDQKQKLTIEMKRQQGLKMRYAAKNLRLEKRIKELENG